MWEFGLRTFGKSVGMVLVAMVLAAGCSKDKGGETTTSTDDAPENDVTKTRTGVITLGNAMFGPEQYLSTRQTAKDDLGPALDHTIIVAMPDGAEITVKATQTGRVTLFGVITNVSIERRCTDTDAVLAEAGEVVDQVPGLKAQWKDAVAAWDAKDRRGQFTVRTDVKNATVTLVVSADPYMGYTFSAFANSAFTKSQLSSELADYVEQAHMHLPGKEMWALSQDGSLLAASQGNSIYIYELPGKTPVATVEVDAMIVSMAFSEDGTRLGVGTRGAGTTWDWRSEKKVASFDHGRTYGNVHVLPGMQHVVAPRRHESYDVLNMDDGSVVRSLSTESGARLDSIDDDGKICFSTGGDGSKSVVEASTDTRLLTTSTGPESNWYGVVDGKRLYGLENGTIWTWSLKSQEAGSSMAVMPGRAMAVSAKLGRIAVACKSWSGDYVFLYDGRGVPLHQLGTGDFETVELHAGGRIAVATGADGLYLWHLDRVKKTLPAAK